MPTLRQIFVHLSVLFAVLIAGVVRGADPILDPTEMRLKEVNSIRSEPFWCKITGEHPIDGLDVDADGLQKICQCESCQRWAFGAMQRLSLPFKSSPADKTLERVERIFLGASRDLHAQEQLKMQKADELGVLHEWIEKRYGRYAIWPDRCALTGIPSESSLITRRGSMNLCACDNCQRWAFDTLQTLTRRVVSPLAKGEQENAMAALKEILEKTRNAGRDVRANTVRPDWVRQVHSDGPQPFRCDLTGQHPETALVKAGNGETKKLCGCDSCQSWAAKTLIVLKNSANAARRGDTNKSLSQLKALAQMTASDFDGWTIRQRKTAAELGVLDEWIEYRFGKMALWPDRCTVTGSYSDMSLMAVQRPLCDCENCQQWAFKSLRDFHVRVTTPLRAGDEEKALAALKEIAGEAPPLPPRPQPRPAVPAPAL